MRKQDLCLTCANAKWSKTDAGGRTNFLGCKLGLNTDKRVTQCWSHHKQF